MVPRVRVVSVEVGGKYPGGTVVIFEVAGKQFRQDRKPTDCPVTVDSVLFLVKEEDPLDSSSTLH